MQIWAKNIRLDTSAYCKDEHIRVRLPPPEEFENSIG
jgi:hypothetical protein